MNIIEKIAYGYVALYALAALVLYVGRRWPAKKAPPKPAQRRMPDFDGFGHTIPCHPTDHKPEIKIGSREWCGVCGYEVRS